MELEFFQTLMPSPCQYNSTNVLRTFLPYQRHNKTLGTENALDNPLSETPSLGSLHWATQISAPELLT